MKAQIRPIPFLLAAVALAAACKKAAPPPMYEAIPVVRRNIVVSASAAGTIEPITTVDVKSKASGEITAVLVQVGDAVKQGQLLVKVDPRIPQNSLQQAEANLEVAKASVANADAQLKRSEQLHQAKAITDQDYETARLTAAQAKAQLVSAQTNLENAKIAFQDTQVRAPSSGIILTRTVDPGTVIQSATANVSGGTTLLTMANLDTVQVEAQVDETDIGKIAAGMPVTITVDAFPNRPFYGQVLKIEPLATTTQNVTMFTVLIRIPNPGLVLKPGMNTEVDVHVGQRDSVLAVPNAALRTPADVASAASVLGLDMQQVQEQLAAQRDSAQGGEASMGGTTASDSSKANGNTITLPDGRTIPIPDGVTKAQAKEVMDFMAKLRSGGGFQNMSDADRAKMQQLRPIMAKLFPRNGGGRFGRGERGGGRPSDAGDNYQFGGTYTVFALRNGQPHAVRIQTGLTDLDYAEVKSGLKEGDTVLVLPSASLIASQQQFQQRIAGRGGLPGVQRNSR
ncbi:MAG TPA: efflux RND transporter periplasmic adaptor subunit [Gemmatimonadales bacterium]|nr:efflux RND transporter periplasmic adaptor subunit [Gemmatimonadales bacterium]